MRQRKSPQKGKLIRQLTKKTGQAMRQWLPKKQQPRPSTKRWVKPTPLLSPPPKTSLLAKQAVDVGKAPLVVGRAVQWPCTYKPAKRKRRRAKRNRLLWRLRLACRRRSQAWRRRQWAVLALELEGQMHLAYRRPTSFGPGSRPYR